MLVDMIIQLVMGKQESQVRILGFVLFGQYLEEVVLYLLKIELAQYSRHSFPKRGILVSGLYIQRGDHVVPGSVGSEVWWVFGRSVGSALDVADHCVGFDVNPTPFAYESFFQGADL